MNRIIKAAIIGAIGGNNSKKGLYDIIEALMTFLELESAKDARKNLALHQKKFPPKSNPGKIYDCTYLPEAPVIDGPVWMEAYRLLQDPAFTDGIIKANGTMPRCCATSPPDHVSKDLQFAELGDDVFLVPSHGTRSYIKCKCKTHNARVNEVRTLTRHRFCVL